jgi:hypothetical protein
MANLKQREAARRNIKAARKKWMKMSHLQRQKAMPGHATGHFHKLPVGSYVMLDIGKKKGHYQFAQKTKYGWNKVEAPKKLLRAGWQETKKGYVYKKR